MTVGPVGAVWRFAPIQATQEMMGTVAVDREMLAGVLNPGAGAGRTVRDLHRVLDTEAVSASFGKLECAGHEGEVGAHWIRTRVGPPASCANALSRNGARTEADGRRSGRHLKHAIM